MSELERDAASKNMQELLEAERTRPEIDPARAARIRDAARQRISGGTPPRGSSGSGGSGGAGPRQLARFIGVFALGAMVGGGAMKLQHERIAQMEPRLAREEVAAPRPPTTSEPSPSPAAEQARPPTELVTAPSAVAAAAGAAVPVRKAAAALDRVSASPATLAPHDAALVAERQLVTRAYSALVRGDYLVALSAVRAHDAQYPSGRLCEERDAIRIQALAGAGRSSEARDAFARFARDYPRSLQLAPLEHSLSTRN